jgi:hypothetical protein
LRRDDVHELEHPVLGEPIRHDRLADSDSEVGEQLLVDGDDIGPHDGVTGYLDRPVVRAGSTTPTCHAR